jgi:hypothetical protein
MTVSILIIEKLAAGVKMKILPAFIGSAIVFATNSSLEAGAIKAFER